MSAIAEFDTAKAEAFAGTFLNALNYASLCFMASIGHRTGLFDVMRGLPPSTVSEIATKSGLNERYVREWLGAMVTGGVIEVDEASTHFHLPTEHAAFLTRAAGVDNIGTTAQYLAVMGSVEDKIVECFKNGGGVPYSEYPRFHEVMSENSEQSVLSLLESHILPLVPGLIDQLEKGIKFLDVGCGSGRIINKLAGLFPNSLFRGLDLSPEAILRGRDEAERLGLKNVEFVIQDLSNFHEIVEVDAYDVVTTFDAIHDQGQPLNVLKGIYRTLKAEGLYLMQDIKASSYVHKNIGHPLGTFLYSISTMHCMTVSLAQNGEGLGAMWGEEKTREYLGKAGFRSVVTNELEHDIANNWYVVRK